MTGNDGAVETLMRGAAQMLLGSDEYEDIKSAVGDKVVGSIEEMLGHALVKKFR